jgi:hypothetical protein
LVWSAISRMVLTMVVMRPVSSPSWPKVCAAFSALLEIATICAVARAITSVPRSARWALSRARSSAAAALATSSSSASTRGLMSAASLMNLQGRPDASNTGL